ncbi:MAG: FG-GAP-like repeat-containing protein [Pyrinomonadaceae bacterium]
MSDAQGQYKISAAHAATTNASAAQLIDYDNDGLLDLVFFAAGKPRALRSIGRQWMDVSARAFAGVLSAANAPAPARSFASGDIDGDGDADLAWLASTGELKVFRNDGGNRNRSLRVQISGKVSNRSGVGAKVEARAGSLKQRAETYSASPAPAPADVQFGIGQRASVDAVRVLWPAGIIQAETEISPAGNPSAAVATAAATTAQNLNVIEVDRKPSSCPFLYTWNGERFEFVTDFMGGGEMGAWLGPGKWNYPDPDEYVRIRGDQLKERNNRYELRVTNELEEVLYVDRLQLIAVAHPADTEVYPNEGLTAQPKPFRLHTVRRPRAPLAATDEHDRDVLPQLAALDRKYVDNFKLHRIRGYAEEHALTLRLDRSRAANGRTVLF